LDGEKLVVRVGRWEVCGLSRDREASGGGTDTNTDQWSRQRQCIASDGGLQKDVCVPRRLHGQEHGHHQDAAL